MDNILSLTATPYIAGSGNPDTAFEVINTVAGSFSPYAPGDLGKLFVQGDRIYQKVILDAGAVAVAVGQLLFWRDRSNYIVTNNADDGLLSDVPESYRNNVAGSIRGIIPVNSQFFMLIHGNNVPILEAGAATPGMMLICDAKVIAARAAKSKSVDQTHSKMADQAHTKSADQAHKKSVIEEGVVEPLAADGLGAIAIGVPIGTPLTHQRLGRVVGPTVDGSCLADFDVVNS
jgi:hypothetical protein